MSKLSTRSKNNFQDDVEMSKVESKCKPQKKTLDFLKQFARVYHAEQNSQIGMSELVLN